MVKSEYSNKLLDPRWQKKRLEILNRDEFVCQRCYDNESTLHVHHLYYEAGKEPWEYEQKDLITLCSDCHEYEKEARTEYEKMLLTLLKKNGFMSDDVYFIVEGFLKLKIEKSPDVTASIIKFALSSGFKDVSDLFWKHTNEIANKRREASK